MQIPRRGTLARELILMIVGSIAAAVILLSAAFLISSAVSSRALVENKLITLADIVSQNSTAALTFGDADAAGGSVVGLPRR
jgi:hypothetical protein